MIQRDVATSTTIRIAAILIAFSFVPFSGDIAAEPEGERVGPKPVLHARSTYAWPYATGPYYSADASAQPPARRPGVVVTQVGTFDLTTGKLPFPQELTATDRLAELVRQYFFVQSTSTPEARKELLTAITQAGGTIVDRLPNGTFIARLTPESMTAIRASSALLHVEPYHPAFKLHPKIGQVPLRDPVRAASDIYLLDVMLWQGEDGQAAADALTELGASVLHVWGDQLRVEAHRTLLTQIAFLEPVRAIFESLPIRPRGEETTTTIQTGQYNYGATPYHDAGIDGGGGGAGVCNNGTEICTYGNEGIDCTDGTPVNGCRLQQVLMVLDTGIQLDAADLAHAGTLAGTPGPTHRKVRLYETTGQFGGQGDLLGCDSTGQGAITHGHVVSAVALGNASLVPAAYGDGFFAVDLSGNNWNLDGVAPGAFLVAYDGQVTLPGVNCANPLQEFITPGDLYDPGMPAQSSLGDAYDNDARIVNLSWGSTANVYTANAADIDTFMQDNPEALVFVAAGDSGNDIVPPGADIPGALTLGSPATTKSGLAIGTSRNADTIDSPNGRAAWSSVGPAIDFVVNRTAPQLMAPGSEPTGGGKLGVRSDFACRSGDNDQNDPVECDVVQSLQGSSFSSAAAAGAALLVRDYFFQGYYPDRTPNVANVVPTVSGALVKAILAASADFMTGENLTRAHRWNNEQGYGRIQLDNVLPLENWPASPTGLIVHDTLNGSVNVSHLNLLPTVSSGQTHVDTFEVCNDEKELRIALAWTDVAAFDLRNNLDLVVISPSLKQYRGNYFSDDNDRDGVNTLDEDCRGIGELEPDGEIDEGAWSLPTCANSKIPGQNEIPANFDETNPIEAVFLSPDPDGNGEVEDGSCEPTSSQPLGTNGMGRCGNDLDCASNPTSPLPGDLCDGGTQQPEIGTWEVQISAGSPFTDPPQDFALVIAGGACLGSSVQWDRSVYTCNTPARIVVTESDDVTDSGCNLVMGCTAPTIENRTTVWVYDETDTLVDCEGFDCSMATQGPTFVQLGSQGLVFESDLVTLTDGTVPVSGNGSVDVRDGDRIEVTYDDNGVLRTSTANVGCGLAIGAGVVQFVQYGRDTAILVQGGCERASPRRERCVSGFCSASGGSCNQDVDCPFKAAGFFEFGFPDRYMDAGELVQLDFAFSSAEPVELQNVWAALKCVEIDQDSPADCRPSGAGCDPIECGGECDPRRENNVRCAAMTILDSRQRIGVLPVDAITSANFAIQMAEEDDLAGNSPTVELVLEVTDETVGKTKAGVAVSRQRLNVDEVVTFYNTDYPTGGIDVVVFDLNNNERQDDPVNDPESNSDLDYRFETRSYGDFTSGLDAAGTPVARNQNVLSPWNFDGNDGGFTSGLASGTDKAAASTSLIHNTGEDQNFNNIEDGYCADDPTIGCYRYPTDLRCPGSTVCNSIENLADDAPTFTPIHHNQRGGCGWQTRPEYVCTGDPSRGCFDDTDCEGTCQASANPAVSTFDACTVACPSTQQCNPTTPNAWAPCSVDADCGEAVPAPGDCLTVPQNCVRSDGPCDLGSPATAGGVLHTGAIGDVGAGTCDGGSGSPCEDYKVISGTGSQLLWWSLWLTPVIEKVDQSIGADGLPNSRIEITQWAWNQSIELADEHAAVSWEFDTDLDSIAPVDLVSDTTVFGLTFGPFGPVTNAGDPQQTGGYSLFAPMASCSGSGGACQVDSDCPPGACTGNPSIECHGDFKCSNQGAGLCVGADFCVQSDTSVNGADPQGNNRVGQNACFFEGPGKLSASVRDDLGLAGPPDNDVDDDSDGLIDEFVTHAGPIRNTDLLALGGPDMRLENLEDFYGETGNRFQAAIGLLNFEGSAASPATGSYGLAVDDMYIEWKEFGLDLDQTSCATGQCAVMELPSGQLYEGVTSIPVSLLDASPYGFACVGGPNDGDRCFPSAPGNSCAPGSCMPAENDCDFNGKFNDFDDDDDCDDNGTPDVVVLATSQADFGEVVVLNQVELQGAEYAGTLAVSVLADSEGALFLSTVGEEPPTVTVTYDDNDDGTGILCQNDVVPEDQGRIQAFATVNVQTCDVQVVATSFTDNGDGDLYPDSSETISLDFDVQNNCSILLTNCVARLSSNSDTVECIKQGTLVLGDLAGSSTGAGPIVPSPSSFVYKMTEDTADRTTQALGPNDPLSATFNIVISCDQIDGVQFPQSFSQSLDLNLFDFGQTPTSYVETFEGGGGNPADPFQGTTFEAQNIDAGIPGPPGNVNGPGLINGDGWRCQYTDPDWVNALSYNQSTAENCFPGLTLAQANAVFWQIDGAGIVGTPDGGRAFGGTRSMYYGIFLNAPDDDFTTPLSLVESAGTVPLINLGTGSPRLSFWHQISIADHRTISAPDRRSADRGAVQIKLFDEGGTSASDWMNLQAIQNGYDEQNADNFFNCEFDPVDDGNTEDDFFDPTDPDRFSGPSSTCFPEFTWAWMGSTTGAFNVADVGHATTPPASTDVPSLGDGTWIETIVDLGEFRGRRAKVRFLVTGIKATAYTLYDQFGDNNEGDDGWWVDNFEIDQTLATPAAFQNDDFDLGHCSIATSTPCIGQCALDPDVSCTSDGVCAAGPGGTCVSPCGGGEGTCVPGPPDCGPICNVVTARAFVTPADLLNPGSVTTAAPGQVLSINGAAAVDLGTGAMPSSSDACLSGNLQFQFCRDGDPLGGGPVAPDGDCDDAEDLLIRSWTENALLTIAPQESATYAMQVRCSTLQTCLDTESVFIDVTCPGGQNALGLKTVFWTDKTTIAWQGAPITVDIWQSLNYTATATGLDNYPGTHTDNFGPATSFPVGATPPLNNVQAILIKGDGTLNTTADGLGYFCNSRTWRSGGATEIKEDGTFSGVSSLGRDTNLGSRP